MSLMNQFDQIIKPHDYLVVEKKEIINISQFSWIEIGKYRCYFGEKVRVCTAEMQTTSILLIGFCMSMANSDADEKTICEDILSKTNSIQEVWNYTDQLYGRWLMLYQNSEDEFIIPDCCAFRQSFYCIDGSKAVSSNPDLLSFVCELKCSDEIEEFERIEKSRDSEYSYPFDASKYSNVYRVLPNHILSLKTLCAKRMWPNKPFSTEEHITNANMISNTFSAMIDSILRKFDHCYFSLTAGIDSRICISSFNQRRQIKNLNSVSAITHSLNGEDTEDVVIARKISEILGITHITIPYKLFDVSENEIDGKHYFWNQVDSCIGEHIKENAVIIKGSAAEICRFPYGVYPRGCFNVELVRKNVHIENTVFSNTIIKKWCQDAIPYAKKFGVSLYDLVYWEHRMGSWQAQGQYESDDYFETFSVFNCRRILISLIATDKSKRVPPYSFFKEIIFAGNSNLYDLPINKDERSIVTPFVKIVKYKLPVLNYIYSILRHY